MAEAREFDLLREVKLENNRGPHLTRPEIFPADFAFEDSIELLYWSLNDFDEPKCATFFDASSSSTGDKKVI